MSIKEFLKSNAFKSLAVLMIIVIVCGGIIAICNGLFYVSDEEITKRAVAKIFGKEPSHMVTLDLSGDPSAASSYGSADKAYFISDEDEDCLLIYSTGVKGYNGGTISLWVVVTVSGAEITDEGKYTGAVLTGISDVKYDNNTSQTLMSNFKASYYNQFTQYDEAVARGAYFTPTQISGSDDTVIQPQTGTSYSSIAIINAVNAALHYARQEADA